MNLSDAFDAQMSHQLGNLAAMLEAPWKSEWLDLVRTVQAA